MRAKFGLQLSFNGQVLSLSDWAERLGVPARRVSKRLKAGWSVDRALTEPRGKTGPRSLKEIRENREPRAMA